ncbi:MAG TPA: polyhydroxyalkanoic acid system family protein [Verrucomicrobiae bacterium]
MPKIHLAVPHALGADEAKKRVTNLVAQTRQDFGGKVSDLSEAWNGFVNTFSFRAIGFSVTGKLEAQPAQVVVDIDLPFAALPFKGRIESELLAHARALLA